METQLGKLFMNSAQVCEVLHISPRTLQNYRDDGRLKCYRLSRKKIVYYVEEVLTLLKNSTASAYYKDKFGYLIEKYRIR